MTITMDNKDNPINLTRKIDVEFMPSMHLRTADNETLRYYIYKLKRLPKTLDADLLPENEISPEMGDYDRHDFNILHSD
jgi:hypothetical protein